MLTYYRVVSFFSALLGNLPPIPATYHPLEHPLLKPWSQNVLYKPKAIVFLHFWNNPISEFDLFPNSSYDQHACPQHHSRLPHPRLCFPHIYCELDHQKLHRWRIPFNLHRKNAASFVVNNLPNNNKAKRK